MSATVLSLPAGTTRQLASGGWAVNLGDLVPTWAPSREAAWELSYTQTPEDSPAGPTDPMRMASTAAARPGPNPLDP